MPTTSQVLQLALYNNTTDKDQLFIDFRDELAGPGANSNMQKIDAFAGTTDDRLQVLESLPHTVTVKATKDADNENNFIATVTGFTGYKTNLVMLIYLPENNAGLTTIKVNDTDTTSLMKIGANGTAVNLDPNDLKANVGYLFQYDGTQLVAIGEAYSEIVYSATQPLAQFTGGLWMKAVAGGTSSLMVKQADGTYIEVPPSTKATIVTFNDGTTLEAFKTTVLANQNTMQENITNLQTASTQHGSDISELQTGLQTANTNIESNLNKINILTKTAFSQNLFDNFNFGNPVNQRGQSQYSFSTPNYCIDRWKLSSGDGSVVLSFNYGNNRPSMVLKTKTATTNGITQPIDPILYKYLFGKTVTVSLLILYKLYTFTFTFPNSLPSSTTYLGSYTQDDIDILVLYESSDSLIYTGFNFKAQNKTYYLVQAKLEIGNNQTLAYKVENTWIPYEIPDYEMMLLRCQRYYQLMNYSYKSICYSGGYLNGFKFFTPVRIIPSFSCIIQSTVTGSFMTLNGYIAKKDGISYLEVNGSVMNEYYILNDISINADL